ncbi:hypothetical protein AMATHDRAFT_141381 [Amanita thiersii Skay4041]|uniref:Uncharacterized protein n=1 Tax=Amanita thiersii Skay4041 TaxID=703135 RepID=A0A2A9NLT8_9AGAR|nr:hypothetical protein AMATHDRAFT_141381 [Amanita thiersii Skay4041]
MSSYLSNHSQSRLLNNTTFNGSNSLTSAHSHTTAPPLRSRLSASKQYSASLSSPTTERAGRTKEASSPAQSVSLTSSPNVHPLRNTWVFWFRQQRSPGNKALNYEEGIKKISSFSSVESFWSLWTHLSPPSALQPTTDYLVFHSGVRRPVWEDPLNHTGGKWIIRLKKGVADRIWEELVLATVGDQFDECRNSVETTRSKGEGEGENGSSSGVEWPEICGCTISVRQNEDIVSLWNRVDGDIKTREKIRDTLRKVLNLHPATVMEYKSNTGKDVMGIDSMQDKSSFRNSAIDRTSYS